MKITIKPLLACLLACFMSFFSMGQSPWFQDSGSPGYESATVVAEKNRIIQIDFEAITNQLQNAPHENAIDPRQSSHLVDIPFPDGRQETIRVVYSPVMEAGLEEFYPQIKTYAGVGLRDPNISVRLSVSPLGFHAQIFDGNKTYYVDPYDLFEQDYCVAYTRKAYYESYSGEAMTCLNGDNENELDPVRNRVSPVRRPGMDPIEDREDRDNALQSGSAARAANTRYDYTISVTATGQYTSFYGGSVAGATSGIVTSLNRVNGIYGRDLGVRLFLSAINNSLIFTNASTDPFTDMTVGGLAAANQTVTNAVIGSANYDVGHIVNAGGGGGVVQGRTCNNGNKARGCTALSSPSGDVFNVDYLSHEIGHQFNGSHTFNSGCNGQRVASTAVEPGNGCTIMAYAGVCGTQNFQTFSEDLFHTASISQITTFVTVGGGASCDNQTGIVNGAPTLVSTDIAAAPIPESTPFYIAAVYEDPNNDPITYVWEQTDTGPQSNNQGDLDNPSGTQPVFRTYNTSTSGRRDFPRRQDLLANAVDWEENLPDYGRRVNLECRVRDNYVVGGCTSTFTTWYDIIDGVGPFAVTSQSSPGLSYETGENVNINWSVNGTDGSPFNTASVRISLSQDGGLTFPVVLTTSTPNDGAYTAVFPLTAIGNNCRILIEPTSNHNYYAINTRSFIIRDGRDLRVNEIVLQPEMGCSATITPQVSFTNLGNGTLTSATFVFERDGTEVLTLPWSGVAAPGTTVITGFNNFYSFSDFTLGSKLLTVEASLNDGAEQNTANNSAERIYFRGNSQINVEVTTDRYGGELSWQIADAGGSIVLTNDGYQTQAVIGTYPQPDETYCLVDGCYVFTAFDSFGDGMCCDDGEGFVAITTASGEQLGITPPENWGLSTSFEFCLVSGCLEPTACNFDPDANIEAPCDFSCYGCTDSEAYNWDIAATIDDGSCEFDCDAIPVTLFLNTDCYPAETFWLIALEGDLDFASTSAGDYSSPNTEYEHRFCLQPGCYDFTIADNFGDGLAGADEGICDSNGSFFIEDEFGNVLVELNSADANFGTSQTFTFCIEEGCNDAGACNFVPDTNGPASLCDYSCFGCTDPLADNFDPIASLDDGSCQVSCNNPNAQLDILTDCYENDISWVITDQIGNVVITFPNGYLGEEVLNELEFCLSSGCYNLTVSDAFGDGLSALSSGCASDGNIVLYIDGEVIYNLAEDGDLTFTQFSVPFCIGNNCPADVDQNGTIGVSDLLAVVGQIGCIADCGNSDVDGDGQVSIGDLLAVSGQLGSDCP